MRRTTAPAAPAIAFRRRPLGSKGTLNRSASRPTTTSFRFELRRATSRTTARLSGGGMRMRTLVRSGVLADKLLSVYQVRLEPGAKDDVSSEMDVAVAETADAYPASWCYLDPTDDSNRGTVDERRSLQRPTGRSYSASSVVRPAGGFTNAVGVAVDGAEN